MKKRAVKNYTDTSEQSATQLKREMLRDAKIERTDFAAGMSQLDGLVNDKRYALFKLCLEREILSLQDTRLGLKESCTSQFELTVKSVDCDAKIEVLKKILNMPKMFRARLQEIDKNIETLRKNLSL